MSRNREPASSRPDTRNAAGSSVTFTMGHNSGSSRSGSRSATSRDNSRRPSPQAATLDATVAELCARDRGAARAGARRPSGGLDDGLAPALRDLASRSRLRTSVEATDERFEDRVETAAYFFASEALTNAAKHAQASSVAVIAARQNGSLVLSVRDDGVGGAVPSPGSGLAGITDRVAALGGSVSVAARPDGEPIVTAELPCGS